MYFTVKVFQKKPAISSVREHDPTRLRKCHSWNKRVIISFHFMSDTFTLKHTACNTIAGTNAKILSTKQYLAYRQCC